VKKGPVGKRKNRQPPNIVLRKKTGRENMRKKKRKGLNGLKGNDSTHGRGKNLWRGRMKSGGGGGDARKRLTIVQGNGKKKTDRDRAQNNYKEKEKKRGEGARPKFKPSRKAVT